MNQSLKKRLRSAPGQLSSLGVLFLGAIALGIVVVCLRSSVFERYSRETYSSLDDRTRPLAQILAVREIREDQLAEVGNQLAERSQNVTLNSQQNNAQPTDLERLYGAWMQDEIADPDGLFPRRLTRLQRDWVFDRLKVTCVAGSPAQQARALVWLRLVSEDRGNFDRARELAEYVRRKAERCGFAEIQHQAEAILALRHGSDRD